MNDDRLSINYEQLLVRIDQNRASLYRTTQKLADTNDVVTRRAAAIARGLCWVLWGVTAVGTIAAVGGAFNGEWGDLVKLVVWTPVAAAVSLWAGHLYRIDWEARRPNEERAAIAAAELQPGEEWPGQHEFRADAALAIAHLEVRDSEIAAWSALPAIAKHKEAQALLSRSRVVSAAMDDLREKWLSL